MKKNKKHQSIRAQRRPFAELEIRVHRHLHALESALIPLKKA